MLQSSNRTEFGANSDGKPVRIEYDADAEGAAERIEDIQTIVPGRHRLTDTENDGTEGVIDAIDRDQPGSGSFTMVKKNGQEYGQIDTPCRKFTAGIDYLRVNDSGSSELHLNAGTVRDTANPGDYFGSCSPCLRALPDPTIRYAGHGIITQGGTGNTVHMEANISRNSFPETTLAIRDSDNDDSADANAAPKTVNCKTCAMYDALWDVSNHSPQNHPTEGRGKCVVGALLTEENAEVKLHATAALAKITAHDGTQNSRKPSSRDYAEADFSGVDSANVRIVNAFVAHINNSSSPEGYLLGRLQSWLGRLGSVLEIGAHHPFSGFSYPPPDAFTFEATLEHIITRVDKNGDGTPDESKKIDFDSNRVLISMDSRVSIGSSYAFADRTDGFGDTHAEHNADIGNGGVGILAIQRGIANLGAPNEMFKSNRCKTNPNHFAIGILMLYLTTARNSRNPLTQSYH